jgi:hypothetical protein
MALSHEKLRQPPLATWMFEYGVKNSEAADFCGVSRMQFSRYCMPFGDPRRQVPSEGVMAKIKAMTGGRIGPADHYPPELSGRPGELCVLEAGRAE